MSDIQFDIYESPDIGGKKKKYQVRSTNRQNIRSKDLMHEASLYASVRRSDWSAAEGDGLLTEYFKGQRSITATQMQQVCGKLRSTAHIPVKGHYGRSYTAGHW